jgi:hypothetical protein
VTSRAGLRLLAVLPASLLVAGCYAVPPLRVGAGGGGAVGTVITQEAAMDRENSLGGTGQLRLGIAPVSYRPARRLDVQLGWSLDSTAGIDGGDKMRHGPYLEGAWFLRRGGASAGQGWRLGPTAGVESSFATDAGDGVGIGGSLGVLLESIESVHGRFPLGQAIGELGIGVGARVGVRNEDGGTYGYGIVSVEFRLPGAYGSVF